MTRQQKQAYSAMAETLLTHFGDQAATDLFMRTFSGMSLNMPPADWVENQIRTRRIQKVLARDPSTGTVRRLASIQSVEMRIISKSFAASNGIGLKALRAANAAKLVGDGVSDDRCNDDPLASAAPVPV